MNFNFFPCLRPLDDLPSTSNSNLQARGWGYLQKAPQCSSKAYLDIHVVIYTYLSGPFLKITSVGNISIFIIGELILFLMIFYKII